MITIYIIPIIFKLLIWVLNPFYINIRLSPSKREFYPLKHLRHPKKGSWTVVVLHPSDFYHKEGFFLPFESHKIIKLIRRDPLLGD